MLVHFVGSRYEISKHIDHLRNITAIIHEEGHELADDWVDIEYGQQTSGARRFEDTDWSVLYKDSVEAINKADVVVAETSTPSFSVGYQVALAVNMKKPTLVLNRDGVEKSFFASGIEVGIEYRKYSDQEQLRKYIARFLDENNIRVKDMRFNFFIDRSIYNYLRWASLKTGKTKAEILRKLIKAEIEKKDY